MPSRKRKRTPDEVTPAKYTSGQACMIKIFVGPEQQEFLIYRKLICSVSPFFEKCFNGDNFKEGATGELYLDDDPKAFEMIVNWIFGWSNTIKGRNEVFTMISAAVLADRFLMIPCKNDLMDTIKNSFALRNFDYLPYCVQLATRKDINISQIWDFCVDETAFLIYHSKRPVVKEELDAREMELVDIIVKDFFKIGGDFVANVSMLLLDYLQSDNGPPDPSGTARCTYHDHPDGNHCYVKSDEKKAQKTRDLVKSHR